MIVASWLITLDGTSPRSGRRLPLPPGAEVHEKKGGRHVVVLTEADDPATLESLRRGFLVAGVHAVELIASFDDSELTAEIVRGPAAALAVAR